MDSNPKDRLSGAVNALADKVVAEAEVALNDVLDQIESAMSNDIKIPFVSTFKEQGESIAKALSTGNVHGARRIHGRLVAQARAAETIIKYEGVKTAIDTWDLILQQGERLLEFAVKEGFKIALPLLVESEEEEQPVAPALEAPAATIAYTPPAQPAADPEDDDDGDDGDPEDEDPSDPEGDDADGTEV